MTGRSGADFDWLQPGALGFVKDLWQAGVSTKLIAGKASAHYHFDLSKNAVVGKIHRMHSIEPGWDPRLSPIKRDNPKTAPAPGPLRFRPCTVRSTLPPLPSEPMPAFADRAPPALPPAATLRSPRSPPAARPQPLRCEARDPNAPLRRRDGTGCLFPKGHPGTPDFRFCDGDLYNLAKPYCDSCRKLAYTKSSDQRLERFLDA